MITYVSSDGAAIDEVAALWEKIKAHHVASTNHFTTDMAAATFAGRKEHLFRKAAGPGGLRVDRAIDDASGQLVGYCVSSITAQCTGEIDSLFVEASCRGQGIGTELTQRALAWLAERGATSTTIGVAEGNESVLRFYARFGFLPRTIILARPSTA
jgi:ribosomal protein S18 acetylase RimI-like enzyme